MSKLRSHPLSQSTITKSSTYQLMAVLSFHLPTSYLCFFLSWSTSNVRKSPAYNHFSFYKFLFLLKYSWHAVLCQSLLYSKVTQFYTYILFFNILFHYGYSSLCCTVGPCCLSIINVMLASNSSDSQFIPLFPPIPLATTSLIIYLDKSIVQKDTCTRMFVASVFITAKTGEQPKRHGAYTQWNTTFP